MLVPQTSALTLTFSPKLATLLFNAAVIRPVRMGSIPWYHLTSADPALVQRRLSDLNALHQHTQKRQFVILIGQTLEIATFRALQAQTTLNFLGHFSDLDAHDDSTLYSKEEPPSSLSGRQIPDGKKLDFLVQHGQTGFAGLEIKNIREWLYPDRAEIRELLMKCCALDVIPVLIARRIHFSTFSVLNPCGVIMHETFSQLYPESAKALAERVKDKDLLGYHDIRVGNTPDSRLTHFIHTNLPAVLPTARQSFDAFKDLLCAYGNEELTYPSFAARVKRRIRGESDDRPEIESDDERYDVPYE
jgi:hypothetical protein